MARRGRHLGLIIIATSVVAFVFGWCLTVSAGAGPLIVIDPGHSGSSLVTLDTLTRLKDYEFNNGTENSQVWAVAVKLKAKLEAAGYTVLLTKSGPQDTVSKRTRVDIADNNGAALAVSIHRDGFTFGTWGQVYVQRTDGYRVNIDGKKVYFSLPVVAAKSLEYGQKILAARRAIEGSSVKLTVAAFVGRGNIPAGNLPLVQLFSKTPWVYCEAGYPDTAARQEAYARGIFNGILASVPVGPVAPPDTTKARYDQTDSRILKTGAWSTFAKSDAYGGSYGRSATTGASATITFNGTRLDWVAMKGTTTGIVDVYLDGGKQTTIDLASPVAAYQVVAWSTGDLPAGVHVVKLVRSAASASGKYITLDAVDVWGSLL